MQKSIFDEYRTWNYDPHRNFHTVLRLTDDCFFSVSTPLTPPQVAPENPKVWRALVEFLETGNDNKALAEALSKCVSIAESKGNFGRSRPLRIRLSEVREAAGDRRGALAALKEFTSNAAAVSASTAPALPPASDKNAVLASKTPAAVAARKAAEAVRDTENKTMKNRSTRLFMEINADLVPPPAPVAAPTPVRVTRPTAAAASPPKAAVTTVAAAAAMAKAASAAGPKLSSWVRNAAKSSSGDVTAPSDETIKAMDDGERLQALAERCGILGDAGDASERRRAAVAVAKFINASNAEAPWVEAQLREFMVEGSTPAAREGSLLAVHAMCQLAGAGGEPYVVALLPLVLLANGSQAAPVRAAAADAGAAIARSLNPHAVRVVLPAITTAVESDRWRIKAGALEVMAILAESSPTQVALALPEIVPVVSHQVRSGPVRSVSISYAGVSVVSFVLFGLCLFLASRGLLSCFGGYVARGCSHLVASDAARLVCLSALCAGDALYVCQGNLFVVCLVYNVRSLVCCCCGCCGRAYFF